LRERKRRRRKEEEVEIEDFPPFFFSGLYLCPFFFLFLSFLFSDPWKQKSFHHHKKKKKHAQ